MEQTTQQAQLPVLECRALQKNYGNVPALNAVSFIVGYGRVLGLLGPNGSGKTTLLKLAAGLLVPTAGEIFVAGWRPGVESKRVISYLPDRDYLDDDMTVYSTCRLFSDFYPEFDASLAQAMARDLGVDPRKRFKSLSKGNREKLQLIFVMSRRASLYLLDEPIAGVDPATRDYILQMIIANRQPNATVIISTHLIQDVEQILDDVLFIKQGNVALYNSAENVRRANGKSVDEVFREVYAYHAPFMTQGGGTGYVS
ncbi:MAG: ABC transporter ATP-binding protein [Lachnospiraceae bacterium]|nr:ABC transporter ATP-binding protein [Lachnospiraceae bacterium]